MTQDETAAPPPATAAPAGNDELRAIMAMLGELVGAPPPAVNTTPAGNDELRAIVDQAIYEHTRAHFDADVRAIVHEMDMASDALPFNEYWTAQVRAIAKQVNATSTKNVVRVHLDADLVVLANIKDIGTTIVLVCLVMQIHSNNTNVFCFVFAVMGMLINMATTLTVCCCRLGELHTQTYVERKNQ
jgi:hypothetical protein